MKRERRIAVLDLPGFSKKQIQKQYDWFFYNIYKGHKPFFNLFKETIYRKLSSNNLLYSIRDKAKSIFR